MFIEEPVLPENNEALTELSRHTSIPVSYTHLDVYKRQGARGRIAAGAFRRAY